MEVPYYFFETAKDGERIKVVFQNKYGDSYKFYGTSIYNAIEEAEKHARKMVAGGRAVEPNFITKKKEEMREEEEEE